MEKKVTMNLLLMLFIFMLPLGQFEGLPLFGGVMYLHELLFPILYAVLLARRNGTASSRQNRIIAAIFGFMIWACLSLLFNRFRFSQTEFLTGSLYFFRWIAYAGLIFMMGPARKDSLKIPRLLFFSYSLFSVFGLIQMIFFPSLRSITSSGWDPHYYRLVSSLLDPNFAGLCILIALILGCTERNDIPEKVFLPLQALNVVALVLTFSRSSLLALAGCLIVYGVYRRDKRIIVLFFCLALVAVLMQMLPYGTLRFFRIESSDARLNNAIQSVRLIGKSPVFGFGFDTLRYYTHSGHSVIPQRSGAGIDNSFLFAAAAAGVPGLLLYGYLWFLLFREKIVRFREQKGTYKEFGYFLVFLAVVIHGMFNNSLFYPWVMAVVWLIA